MRVLVTGGAGFLGSHLCEKLVADGHRVTVLDDFNDYYDPAAKERNLAPLTEKKAVRVVRGDIRDTEAVARAFREAHPEVVVHLAARAGVRPSVAEPRLYHDVNTLGTLAVLEQARRADVQRFVFSSSSSVYGRSSKPAGTPLAEGDSVEDPVSPYGATKRAGEHHVKVFHRLHGIPSVCLRFFTAYGPRQRPDMAIHKFAKLIAAGQPVPIYGDGLTPKDYTYVGDIVEGIVAAIERPLEFEIVNLGGGHAVRLIDIPRKIAALLGKPLQVTHLSLQPGDVMESLADLAKARAVLGWTPKVGFDEGLARFADWFRSKD